MHLTLVIPGLLDAAPSALAAADASATALARILAACAAPTLRAEGLPAILCESLAIDRQSDWPIAPWRARANTIDPGNAYWLCADPVNLVVQRDSVRLDRIVNDLDVADAAALIAALNAHFSGDGLRFHAPEPQRWLVKIDQPQHIETSPADVALGKEVLPFLPRGPDGARWRGWQNEMQMLLFDHPINRDRESSRRPTVNSVWLWGGGVFEAARTAPSSKKIYSGDPWMREVAAAAGMTAIAVPESLAPVLDARCADALVCVDGPPIVEFDQIAALDRAWFQPLANALQRGSLDAVDMVFLRQSGLMSFAARRESAFRRWRSRWSRHSLARLLAIEPRNP